MIIYKVKKVKITEIKKSDAEVLEPGFSMGEFDTLPETAKSFSSEDDAKKYISTLKTKIERYNSGILFDVTEYYLEKVEEDEEGEEVSWDTLIFSSMEISLNRSDDLSVIGSFNSLKSAFSAYYNLIDKEDARPEDYYLQF